MISGTYAPDTYNGNGATTSFAITFEFLDVSTNIAVSLKDTTTGVITAQTTPTHYSVSGSNVVFVTAPATGNTVIIELELDGLQETDYREYDLFPAETHEAALDKLALEAQVSSNTVARALKVDAAISGFDATIVGTPAAGQVPVINDDEDGIEWTDAADAGLLTLGTGVSAFLETPTSANLATAVTDETGTGSLVFATSPTLAGTVGLTGASVTDGTFNNPTLTSAQLGTPDSGTLTNCTGLPEAGLTLADNTTNNASTSNHGFLKKLSNVSTEFMNGQGNWATPAAGGSWTLISTTTASSSATVDFTGLSSSYKVYAVVCTSVVPATNATGLYLRTSTDNGSTYDAGATDYDQAAYVNYPAMASLTLGNSTGQTFIDLGSSQSNTATNGGFHSIVYISAPSAANRCNIWADLQYYNTSVSSLLGYTVKATRRTAADVDAIRFLYSSGNIASGTFKLFGIN